MENIHDEKVKVGISSCLLGQEVRFNGGHKRDTFILNELGRYFEFQPFCPEVEAGLGIPRQVIRLIQTDQGDRAVNSGDYSIDHTETLTRLADGQLASLQNLCGYIFMQKSPSCGVFRVKSYHPDSGIPDPKGEGVFAARVRQLLPWLPVEEAGRLHDSKLGENFLTRVFTLSDWRKNVQAMPSIARLMEFQSRNKYLLMAHNPQLAKQLGAELAAVKRDELETFLPRYRQVLMQILARPASRGQKINALEHIKGYLKNYLSAKEKRLLQQIIEDYRQDQVPFVVPMTMIHHLINVHLSDHTYLQQQSFLEPVPKKLGFSNRT